MVKRLLTIAAVLVISFVFLGSAAYEWRAQHSGIPARVEVTHCLGTTHARCFGTAFFPEAPSTPLQPVSIAGPVGRDDIGKTVDARIDQSGKAWMKYDGPLYLAVVGLTMLVVCAALVVRALKPRSSV